MTSDSTIVPLRQPDAVDDPLTAIVRDGARRLLAQAVEAEAEAFLFDAERSAAGWARSSRAARVWAGANDPDGDRPGGGAEGQATRPEWRRGRRTGSLHLGDPAALVAADPQPGCPAADPLSARGLGRRFPGSARGPSRQRRAEPIAVGHCAAEGRMGSRVCPLAATGAVGAPLRLHLGRWRLSAGAHGAAGRVHAGRDRSDAGREEGTARLSGWRAGKRAELAGAARRVEGSRPGDRAELATGDGALGFWKALEEVFPTTRHQRCTVHKTANVLDKLPTSVQPAAKRDLRQIWTAPDRKAAAAAMALFAEKYSAKYERAVTCLVKDRDALLTFYDFPAEHWDHLRTANPIESVFATVRHRTVRTRGALSQDTARLMVFKLIMAAAKTWRRLKGENQLPKVIAGVTFRNGLEVTDTPKQSAA